MTRTRAGGGILAALVLTACGSGPRFELDRSVASLTLESANPPIFVAHSESAPGVPLRFLVDTGCTCSIVDRDSAARAGAVLEDRSQPAEGTTMAGPVSFRQDALMPTLAAAGGVSIPAARFLATDLSQLGHGIAGLDLFLGVAMAGPGNADARVPAILLGSSDAVRAAAGCDESWMREPLSVSGGQIRLQVSDRDGREHATAVLDTGTSRTFLPESLARAWGFQFASSPTEIEAGSIGGTATASVRTARGRLRVGTTIFELEVLCGPNDWPPVLGMDVVGSRPWVLDLVRNELWLRPDRG